MSTYIVTVIDEADRSKYFRSELEHSTFAAAINSVTFDLIEVYEDSGKHPPHILIIVIQKRDFDVPPCAWRLDCTTKEYAPCDVPCGECFGYGVVDSGGVDPQGHGINIPCPRCKPTDPNSKPDLKAWTGGRAASEALSRLQDEVWGSLDKYSKKLGWGLTGIQPECWAMLDAAVEELVQARSTRLAVKRLLDDLPAKRDWLDPDIEKVLKEFVAKYD